MILFEVTFTRFEINVTRIQFWSHQVSGSWSYIVDGGNSTPVGSYQMHVTVTQSLRFDLMIVI